MDEDAEKAVDNINIISTIRWPVPIIVNLYVPINISHYTSNVPAIHHAKSVDSVKSEVTQKGRDSMSDVV